MAADVGEWPSRRLWHRNGDPSDCRIDNLMLAEAHLSGRHSSKRLGSDNMSLRPVMGDAWSSRARQHGCQPLQCQTLFADRHQPFLGELIIAPISDSGFMCIVPVASGGFDGEQARQDRCDGFRHWCGSTKANRACGASWFAINHDEFGY
jgi:hypothetical protein